MIFVKVSIFLKLERFERKIFISLPFPSFLNKQKLHPFHFSFLLFPPPLAFFPFFSLQSCYPNIVPMFTVLFVNFRVQFRKDLSLFFCVFLCMFCRGFLASLAPFTIQFLCVHCCFMLSKRSVSSTYMLLPCRLSFLATGRFLGELTKQVFSDLAASKYQVMFHQLLVLCNFVYVHFWQR